MTEQLLETLRAAVGPNHVLTDPDLRAGYETDWTGRWRGEALAVVRPASTSEVVAVVRVCAAAGAGRPGHAKATANAASHARRIALPPLMGRTVRRDAS